MSLVTVPDALACTSEWLRGQPELTSLVSTRVYTELPAAKQFPLLRLNQLTDPPVIPHIHYAVAALLQFDAYGGSKKMARNVAETTRALLSQRYPGAHDLDAGFLVVNNVSPGGIRFLTEDIEGSARPRCTFDAVITLHG